MTASPPVLLDTDILSAILRGDAVVTARAQDYLRVHQRFALSIITRYEILRGLKAKRATKQQAAFDRFCAASTVLPLSDAIVVRATEIYAALYQRGELIGDADTLIAATAIVEGRNLSTNNERHFERIEGLEIDNWLK
ncbi:MAG: type II toxin-antitoxin system VapC family toxin [Rubrobacteraceae bacterium]